MTPRNLTFQRLIIGAFVVLALALVATVASAQAVVNCVSAACNFRSDAFPATGVQPVSCKLYDNGTLVTQTPVAGAAGAVYCSFSRTFASGAHNLTATAVAADGYESSASNTLALTSSAGAPPAPTNLRRI